MVISRKWLINKLVLSHKIRISSSSEGGVVVLVRDQWSEVTGSIERARKRRNLVTYYLLCKILRVTSTADCCMHSATRAMLLIFHIR